METMLAWSLVISGLANTAALILCARGLFLIEKFLRHATFVKLVEALERPDVAREEPQGQYP
jgi:hypothetical protein